MWKLYILPVLIGSFRLIIVYYYYTKYTNEVEKNRKKCRNLKNFVTKLHKKVSYIIER